MWLTGSFSVPQTATGDRGPTIPVQPAPAKPAHPHACFFTQAVESTSAETERGATFSGAPGTAALRPQHASPSWGCPISIDNCSSGELTPMGRRAVPLGLKVEDIWRAILLPLAEQVCPPCITAYAPSPNSTRSSLPIAVWRRNFQWRSGGSSFRLVACRDKSPFANPADHAKPSCLSSPRRSRKPSNPLSEGTKRTRWQLRSA